MPTDTVARSPGALPTGSAHGIRRGAYHRFPGGDISVVIVSEALERENDTGLFHDLGGAAVARFPSVAIRVGRSRAKIARVVAAAIGATGPETIRQFLSGHPGHGPAQDQHARQGAEPSSKRSAPG